MLELKDVKRDAKGICRLRLLQDAMAVDNCWNQPKALALVAGTVLECHENQSGHRGDLFFRVAGTGVSVMLRPPAFVTRHPYDLGQYHPGHLVALDPDSATN
jgi:hypothetical protein